MDKNSPDYMKSSYERKLYGNENYTTYEREFKISGNNSEKMRGAAGVKNDVMP